MELFQHYFLSAHIIKGDFLAQWISLVYGPLRTLLNVVSRTRGKTSAELFSTKHDSCKMTCAQARVATQPG